MKFVNPLLRLMESNSDTGMYEGRDLKHFSLSLALISMTTDMISQDLK